MKATLIEKLNGKTATIGIIGLGYVGLSLISAPPKKNSDHESKSADLPSAKIFFLSIPRSAKTRPIPITIRKLSLKFAGNDFGLAGEVNISMHNYVMANVMEALNTHGKSLTHCNY